MELEEQVTLTCEASGDPIPSITWRTSTRNISSEEKVWYHQEFLGHGMQAQSSSRLPGPRSLQGARRWVAGPGGHARSHGLHPPACLAVAWSVSPCGGRATVSCIDLSTGREVRGHGQVSCSGEEAGSVFQTQEYGAMRSKEKSRAWWSSCHRLRGTEGNVSWK